MEDISNCEIEFDEPTRKRMDTFLRKLGANDRFIDSVKQRVSDVDVQNVCTSKSIQSLRERFHRHALLWPN